MKTRNSHGLLQLGRGALAYCQCASALISGNKALFVSVDLIGEKNQVILEFPFKIREHEHPNHQKHNRFGYKVLKIWSTTCTCWVSGCRIGGYSRLLHVDNYIIWVRCVSWLYVSNHVWVRLAMGWWHVRRRLCSSIPWRRLGLTGILGFGYPGRFPGPQHR